MNPPEEFQKDACVSLTTNELHNVVDAPAMMSQCPHFLISMIRSLGLMTRIFPQVPQVQADNFMYSSSVCRRRCLQETAHVDIKIFAGNWGKLLGIWIVGFGGPRETDKHHSDWSSQVDSIDDINY